MISSLQDTQKEIRIFRFPFIFKIETNTIMVPKLSINSDATFNVASLATLATRKERLMYLSLRNMKNTRVSKKKNFITINVVNCIPTFASEVRPPQRL